MPTHYKWLYVVEVRGKSYTFQIQHEDDAPWIATGTTPGSERIVLQTNSMAELREAMIEAIGLWLDDTAEEAKE